MIVNDDDAGIPGALERQLPIVSARHLFLAHKRDCEGCISELFRRRQNIPLSILVFSMIFSFQL